MSYTPSTSFDFTGVTGYTPETDFDFSGGEAQPYDLTVGQQWAATGAGIAEQQAQAVWALTAQIKADCPISSRWDLSAPTFRNLSENAKWAQSAPTFRNLLPSHSWALDVPTFADAQIWQAYAVTPASFTDVLLASAWTLTAPAVFNLAARQVWQLEATAVWTKVINSTAYLFTLENGEDSAEIPIENFSGQFRSGEPSYLQVSLPDAWTHADTIASYAALEGTEMVINAGYRWSDNSYTTQEIARVTLRNVQYYYGARSASVNLDGIDTRTNATPATHALTGANYYSIDTDGRTRYRCVPDFSVRAGDTVTVNGDTFVVGELSYQVSASDATMEVAELIETA